MRRGLVLLLLVILPATAAQADGGVGYGPVPDALAGVSLDETATTQGPMALALIRAREDVPYGRALLTMLGDAGLRLAAERLAADDVTAHEKAALLAVVGAARHPAADTLLAHAAREPRPLYRTLAAHGLGRGRSAAAVEPLAALARDRLPVVRMAAIRSLFAIDTDAARAARIAVPIDRNPTLYARRLAWHARARDRDPALLQMARDAYRDGHDATLRMEAAHFLTQAGLQADLPTLEMILREFGGGPIAAWVIRLARNAALETYDPVRARRIAIDACFTALAHADATDAQRAHWLRWATGWVADPVPMDPYSLESIPEFVLRRRLPDAGPALATPVVDYLLRGAFDDPRKGMVLLRELGAETALPILRTILAPRDTTPPFESRAEAQRRRYLRSAAAGVVQEIGRVGDEALARALLLGDEPMALKVEIVQALDGDEGVWAVPLLVTLMQQEHMGLRTDAILALERRSEQAAREALAEDLFARKQRLHDRLRALTRRGDAFGLGVIERALGHDESRMRRAALAQFHRRRNPKLCTNGAKLVLAYKPDLTSPREVEGMIRALLSVDPGEAVAFVDRHWDTFPKDDMRYTSLRQLGETTGKEARAAAMDLALARTPLADAPQPLALAAAAAFHGPAFVYDWTYRPEDVGRYFRAWLASENVRLQREALTAWSSENAPPAVERLVELLTRAREGRALPERDSTHVGEQEFAVRVLNALTSQAWEDVEPVFVDVALDRLSDVDLAIEAARRMIGRISETTRARLSTWLDFDEEPDASAPGRRANNFLQLFLAAAIGNGADAETAMRLQRVLARELWSFFDEKWIRRLIDEGPAVLIGTLRGRGKQAEVTAAHAFQTRVQALARAVSSARHEEATLATLRLVFDPRLAIFARECVRREAPFLREAGAAAPAGKPSELQALGHQHWESFHWGMPLPVFQILREAKVVGDTKLAQAFERVLADAHASGTLARFPLLYLVRVLESQLDVESGRKLKTADVLWRYGALYGEDDTPLQYFMRMKQAIQLAEARRFAEAAVAQRHVVRTLVRGSHDTRLPVYFARQEALVLTFEGGALPTSDDAGREARFVAAEALLPHDPDALNSVAWYRALANQGLASAERAARRSTRLEARIENRPGINAADTLAYVLLLRGKAREGLGVLAPRMTERRARENGLLHFHLAQMHAALGRLRSARDALIEALTWDRALERDVAGDPFLAPLLEKLPLERIAELAATRRFEEQLPH